MDENINDMPLKRRRWKDCHHRASAIVEEYEHCDQTEFGCYRKGKDAPHSPQQSQVSCSEERAMSLPENHITCSYVVVRGELNWNTVPHLKEICCLILHKAESERTERFNHQQDLMIAVPPEGNLCLMEDKAEQEEARSPKATYPAQDTDAEVDSEDSHGTATEAEKHHEQRVDIWRPVLHFGACSPTLCEQREGNRSSMVAGDSLKSALNTSTTSDRAVTILWTQTSSRHLAAESKCMAWPENTELPDKESVRPGNSAEDKTPNTSPSVSRRMLTRVISFICGSFLINLNAILAILSEEAEEDEDPMAEVQNCSKPVSGADGEHGYIVSDCLIQCCSTGKDEDKNLLKTNERETQMNLPENQDTATQMTLPENQDTATQMTLPENQDTATQMTVPENQDTATQMTLPENQDTATQMTLPENQDKATQANLLDLTDGEIQMNALDMEAKEVQLSDMSFPQSEADLSKDRSGTDAEGGVEEELTLEENGRRPSERQITGQDHPLKRLMHAEREEAEVKLERNTELAMQGRERHGIQEQQMAGPTLHDYLRDSDDDERHSVPFMVTDNDEVVNVERNIASEGWLVYESTVDEGIHDDPSVVKKKQGQTDTTQPSQDSDRQLSLSENTPYKRLAASTNQHPKPLMISVSTKQTKDTSALGETSPHLFISKDTDKKLKVFLKESAKSPTDKKSDMNGKNDDDEEDVLLSRHYRASHILPGLREWTVSMLRTSQTAAMAAAVASKPPRADADFHNEWQRLATFCQYQPPAGLFLLPIANNGFFLPPDNTSHDQPGSNRSVECAFCGVKVPILRFQEGRGVEEVHRRASPSCAVVCGESRRDNITIADSAHGPQRSALDRLPSSSDGAGSEGHARSLPCPAPTPVSQWQTEVLQTDACPVSADSGKDIAAAVVATGHLDGFPVTTATECPKPRIDNSTTSRPATAESSRTVPTQAQTPPDRATSSSSSNATGTLASAPRSSSTTSIATTSTSSTVAASSVAFSSTTNSATATTTTSYAASTARPTSTATATAASVSSSSSSSSAATTATSAATDTASATQSGTPPTTTGDHNEITQSPQERPRAPDTENLPVSSSPATAAAAAAASTGAEAGLSSTTQGQGTGNQGTAALAGTPDAPSSSSSSSSSPPSSSRRPGESGGETGDGGGGGNGEGSSTGNETERQTVTYEDLGIFAQQPKRPDMAVTQIRINTFNEWPHPNTHPVPKMAEAGFYYTGHMDLVRCFYCKGGLKTWERSDQPWVEHCRWFPRCPFVRLAKGQRFVDVVQKLNSVGNQPTITEEEVMQEVARLDSEDRNNAATQSPPEQAEGGEAVVVDPYEEVLKKAGLREGVDLAAETLQDISARLEDEQEDIRSDTLCKMCQSQEVNVLFLPCGHLVACAQCAPALRTCAMCRQQVKGSVRVRMYEDMDDGRDSQQEGADTGEATASGGS